MFSIILFYMLVWFLRFTESPVITGDVSVIVEFTSDIILSVFDISFIRIFGHFCRKHLLNSSSLSEPGHFFPPFSGSGSLHSL